MRKILKTWMLPISMVGGVLFHNYIGYVKFLTPYLIFVMLLITYMRITPREFRVTRFHWVLLAVQIIGCWASYLLLLPISEMLAQGAFVCFFISTATSAPVITGMLGGSVPRLATYSLLSNITFALLSPFFLSLISDYRQIEFVDSFQKICSEVVPLLILPIIVAMMIRYSSPRFHKIIVDHQSVSFYLWAVALFIVVGNSVSFIIKQPTKEFSEMIWLALVSLVVCCTQFYVGRRIGFRLGDAVAGAQGLGQKNTILAIWVAMTYLNPIISVAPAAYVAWQNIINSSQLYFKAKKGAI
ncbi:MAG: transporter [Muribaculaceae bacterium]|nr:transporter [Muribaculaceae bacterium]